VRLRLLGIDSEAVFTSRTTLVALDGGDELEVVAPSPGQVSALRFGDIEIPRKTGSGAPPSPH
jgi:hypothetical protein